MPEVMTIVISLYITIAFVVSISEFVHLIEEEKITPSLLYENSKINWFGCWFCFILLRVFSPIITIFTFIYWLFHVGREDNE